MVVKARAVDLERRYTSREFEQMPEFGENYELINGRIVKKEMAGDEHSTIADELLVALRFFDKKQKIGKAWREVTVELDQENDRAPDLCFIVAERVPALSKGLLKVIPDLAVEVWSPHDLDSANRYQEALDKIQEYLVVGVKIVWAINPRTQTVEVYHFGQITPVQILGLTDELSGEDLIPGFKMKVSELFQ